MVRPRPSDEDEDLVDEETTPTRTRRPAPPGDGPPPVDGAPTAARPRYDGGRFDPGRAEEDADEEGEERRSRWHRDRTPVFWRARDSLYFGPLVALAIVVILISSLYAFTQNWPPVYVVESGSMQHGTNDVVGLINAGDLVLAQKIPTSSIQTYSDGYSLWVLDLRGVRGRPPLLAERGKQHPHHPSGDPLPAVRSPHQRVQPLEPHRPPVREHPGVGLLVAGLNPLQDTVSVTGTLDLFHVGWMNGNVTIQLTPSVIGAHSGYLTMGDNNTVCGAPSCPLLPDQGNNAWLSQLVEPAWIIGAARGMLPWFGAFKLALEGRGSAVPAQSWEFLGLTIAGLILLALGIHFALRAEGIEDPRRLEQEEEDEEDEATEAPPIGMSRGRRILRSLRPWRSVDEEEDGEPEPAFRHARTPSEAHDELPSGSPAPPRAPRRAFESEGRDPGPTRTRISRSPPRASL